MEQFDLVPLSVYNSSTNPSIVTKEEPHKFKPDQNPTYHKGTTRKKITQQLTRTATSVLNKILESPRVKLSNLKTLILDGIETSVLLKDFSQHLKRKNEPIRDFYFTLLDAASISPDFVINIHAKGEKRGAWIPFRI